MNSLAVDPKAEELPVEELSTDPKVGRWFWVTSEDKKWLGCVVQVGSNFIKLQGINHSTRIHTDNFYSICEFIEEPQKIIENHVEKFKVEAFELMAKVREITARLAITTGPMLTTGSETSALATHTGQAIDEYSKALVLAKEKTLPELFEKIKEANEKLGKWMSAALIPLKAQASMLEPAIEAIENRIFSVELYAGLVEHVEQIKEGAPANLTDKVHLFQRRHYMDEECLVNYEAGGMEFKDIGAFDRWFTRSDNLNRLLPFPRCILALRVRRNDKLRRIIDLSSLLEVIENVKLDKYTFLYIRNGEQVFRLGTAIDFDEKLFPDMDHNILGSSKLYVKMYGSSVDKLITEDQYRGMCEEEHKEQEKINSLPESEQQWRHVWAHSAEYSLYNQDNVYYDEITKHIQSELAKHNRLVLILQGLLDRSPTLHPHPPWQLWSDGGFEQALELIYDDSRSLTVGDPPDFEAYRAKLNQSLEVGSITIGQDTAWEYFEGEKESARLNSRYHSGVERYRPYGNPGPGKLARVAKISKSKCTYEWIRNRKVRFDSWDNKLPESIGCSFTCDKSKVLNVSAYKRGDFKQFFDDPRTRADYLKWAWTLIQAEEYHAGNRKVADLIVKPPRRKTDDGSYKYRKLKEQKALIGEAVRLNRVVTTKGGKKYEVNSLWRVNSISKGLFSIVAINEDGSEKKDSAYISGVDMHSIDVDTTVYKGEKI